MADTPPPEPLDLGDVKVNLRIDTSAEDDLITALIVAAREHVEDYTGLVLTPRTVTETTSQLGSWVDLSSWPVQAVTAIRYIAADGSVQTMAAPSYYAGRSRRPVRIVPASYGWGGIALPCGTRSYHLVEIDVVAGFATPADVPQTIKQAMQLLVSHFYSNRSAAEVGARAAGVEIPFGVEALLRRWRLATI